MKKLRLLFAVIGLVVLASCVQKKSEYRMTPDAGSARSAYGTDLVIEPADDSVTITRNTILIAPHEENRTYTLKGYFNGQVISTTKNTTIRLNGAFLENTLGAPALKGEAKTEISTVKDSVNYIVSSGRGSSRNAALQCRRSLIIGGSGTLYALGNVCHGIEAEDVKLKGTGCLIAQGTSYGSALNCESLAAEKDKTFSAYFINSKNGIKADGTIRIASGNFYFYNNGTALKTDTARESPKIAHAIKLSGGTFNTFDNGAFFKTQEGAFYCDGAEFIEHAVEDDDTEGNDAE